MNAWLRGGLVVVGAVWIAFCASNCKPPADLAAPCDSITLAQKAVDCRALVRAKCHRSDAGAVDEACPELQQCSAWGRLWLACQADGAALEEAGAK